MRSRDSIKYNMLMCQVGREENRVGIAFPSMLIDRAAPSRGRRRANNSGEGKGWASIRVEKAVVYYISTGMYEKDKIRKEKMLEPASQRERERERRIDRKRENILEYVLEEKRKQAKHKKIPTPGCDSRLLGTSGWATK